MKIFRSWGFLVVATLALLGLAACADDPGPPGASLSHVSQGKAVLGIAVMAAAAVEKVEPRTNRDAITATVAELGRMPHALPVAGTAMQAGQVKGPLPCDGLPRNIRA